MNNDALIAHLADTARKAARTLTSSSYADRKAALLAIADAIESRQSEIIASNTEDMNRGKSNGLNSQLLDRLMLNESRIKGIAGGARKVAALPDPLGNVLRERTLENIDFSRSSPTHTFGRSRHHSRTTSCSREG